MIQGLSWPSLWHLHFASVMAAAEGAGVSFDTKVVATVAVNGFK